MKVNDLTNEGIKDLWQKAQSKIQGWQAGRQAAQSASELDRDAKDIMKQTLFPAWNKFLISQPGYQNLTSVQLNDLIVNWINNRWKDRVTTSNIPNPTIQNAKDTRGMYDYLLQRTREYLTASPGMKSAAPPPPAAPKPTLAPDTKIVNLDPIIIRYRNQDFSLDDTGNWVMNNSKKPISQAWQKFLDQQHDVALKSNAVPVPESVQLAEGGAAVSNAEPVNKEDVANVVTLAKSHLPPQLAKYLQTDIGSAGYKIASGDIDLMVDADQVIEFFKTAEAKDPTLAAKRMLQNYFENQGLEANVRGRNVHVGIKYKSRGSDKVKIAQVDVMIIPEAGIVAPWHQHGLRGQYADPEFKGSELFMLISSIAKALNLKFDAFGGKLMNRETGEVMARTRPEVAKILLGPRAKESDLDSVKSILRALENDPDKEQKLAQARQDSSKGLLRLPEVAPAGTAAWFNDQVNKLL